MNGIGGKKDKTKETGVSHTIHSHFSQINPDKKSRRKMAPLLRGVFVRVTAIKKNYHNIWLFQNGPDVSARLQKGPVRPRVTTSGT